MRISISLLFVLIFSYYSKAQSVGDTLIVKTFNYTQTYGVNQWSPGIRDTMINFPADTGMSFERILMYYNIRCKNGLVSPAVSGQTDIGCGEWDISCNTFITDSSQTDSVLSTTNNYWISNFSGTTFNYSSTPMNDYYKYLQYSVSLDSIVTDTQSLIGTANSTFSFLPPSSKEVKTQFIIQSSELQSANASAGDIDGIILHALNGPSEYKFLKIKIKHTSDSVLLTSDVDIQGFTEVYFHDVVLNNDSNRLQFYTPFAWNGLDNILVEISYSNKTDNAGTILKTNTSSTGISMVSIDDRCFVFNGNNYAVAPAYKGIPGSEARTIEAWIKTDVAGKDIISWGANTSSNKWIFRVNSSGGVRVEVNGGNIIGPTNVADNKWHHIAAVMSSGSSVSSIKLYVDGVLETGTTGTNYSINTDTANGIDVVLSQGFHNRFWDGSVDEIRVWSTDLDAATLQKWKSRKLDSSHVDYSNLELYYNFDETDGDTIYDYSGNGRNAIVHNKAFRNSIKGENAFKSFVLQNQQAAVTVLQGDYNITISTDTVLDTIPRLGNNVKEYQVYSNWGSQINDDILTVMDTTLWEAGPEWIYDPLTNNILDTIMVTPDGTINISTLQYYKRYPMKFEIMSFVTPYGINLDLGLNGKTWTFDVTDFAPILKGRKRMTVENGGQWMEDMDIRFAFISGVPTRDVESIQQIWKVQKPSYAAIMSDASFEPRTIVKQNASSMFKVRSAITGHGQQGEFTPINHQININGGAIDYTWPVWKQCSNNPIYPQGGTWIYSRAGWCPGAPTNIKEIEITDKVATNPSFTIDYNIASGSGSSNYIVNNQLVSYGSNNFQSDALLLDVKAPTSKVEYARSGIICATPEILVRNTGSDSITSMVIHYWVNNNPVPNVYNWSGSLGFNNEVSIELQADSALWSSLNQSNNVFHAEIFKVNGKDDDYAYNNLYHSKFEIPEVLPSDFVIFLYTNNAPQETSYKIFDSYGNLVHSKSGFSAHTFYRDTLNLGVGCYKLEVYDSDGDGLKFFANNDGSGFINIRNLNGQVVRNFNADFGDKITYNFTVDYPLVYKEIARVEKSIVFPNPNNGQFNILFGRTQQKSIHITDATGRIIYTKESIPANVSEYKAYLTNQSPGLYFLRIDYIDTYEDFKILIK
jgi:hypothetical protein